MVVAFVDSSSFFYGSCFYSFYPEILEWHRFHNIFNYATFACSSGEFLAVAISATVFLNPLFSLWFYWRGISLGNSLKVDIFAVRCSSINQLQNQTSPVNRGFFCFLMFENVCCNPRLLGDMLWASRCNSSVATANCCFPANAIMKKPWAITPSWVRLNAWAIKDAWPGTAFVA